jgi:hypothetical protein
VREMCEWLACSPDADFQPFVSHSAGAVLHHTVRARTRGEPTSSYDVSPADAG